MKLKLPNNHGRLIDYTVIGKSFEATTLTDQNFRKLFAAAHVVPDPFSKDNPSPTPILDWDATLSFRRHLAGLGLGIAEAMDTSQRGNGLSWTVALELIKQTLTELPDATISSGAGTDHLDLEIPTSLEGVKKAYLHQIDSIQKLGGNIILMASRALARTANTAQDYIGVYKEILSACDNPAIIHWLGDMFDPQLSGYWGSNDWDHNLETVLTIIDQSSDKVDGIKLSLLDKNKEIELRRKLPSKVRMYTGDDFNYPELILGDELGYSDALLGIFDPLATVCTHAINALSQGNQSEYKSLFDPTVPLARHIFQSPTQHYKTGVVFLAWLNGFQDHFIMVNGAQAMRSLPYFVECFKLADQANILMKPEMAVDRMKSLMLIYGV